MLGTPAAPLHTGEMDVAEAIATRITVDRAKLAEYCRAMRVRRLSLFGSVLRDDFGPDSDIDIIVEFEPEALPGLKFFGMGEELSELFGRTADVNTPECLHPRWREAVRREAMVLYDAA